MQALFAPEGIHFAYGRIPMGANDFARDYYTCNDTAGDFEMRHFTIERDKQAMIPYVKAALIRSLGYGLRLGHRRFG